MFKDRDIERVRDGSTFAMAGWLIGSGAFQTGDFEFNSGLPSPMKIEVDRPSIYSEFHTVVSAGIADHIDFADTHPDILVGVITGGASFAYHTSQILDTRFASRLGNTDTDEKKKLVHGEIKPGDKVVLIEDAVTTGGNTLATKERVEAEGGKVILAVSIFDYGFPIARDNFNSAGLPHTSLTTLAHLIQVLEWENEQGLVFRLKAWRDKTVPEFFANQG
ncbi:hypothetical protein HYZ78_03305 [Candidatus Microgenomates bacterium]|nr:hypothetical protein [Candidatus Microgenomates bacterium]